MLDLYLVAFPFFIKRRNGTLQPFSGKSHSLCIFLSKKKNSQQQQVEGSACKFL